MDITLDSAVVQQVLLDQIRETNENRYYLMSVIRQLEKNHAEELARVTAENAAELKRFQDAYYSLSKETADVDSHHHEATDWDK